MSEQKTITIAVPCEIRDAGGAGGAGTWTEHDGRKGVWVARAEQEVLIWHDDLHRAIERAAWPSEPTTDHARRVAEIEARHAAATPGPLVEINRGEIAEADPARRLARDPNVGEPLAVVAGNMRVKDAVALARFFAAAREDVPWLLSQFRAVSAALTEAGIPEDGRPPAERIGDLAAALRAAKVLTADGTLGECGEDILRAAEMLRRVARGATVEHDCGGSPTCPVCSARSVRGPVDPGLDVEEPARCGVEQAERYGGEAGSEGAHAGSIAAAPTSRKENRPDTDDRLLAAHRRVEAIEDPMKRSEARRRLGVSFSAPKDAVVRGGRIEGDEVVWPDGERYPIGPDALATLRPVVSPPPDPSADEPAVSDEPRRPRTVDLLFDGGPCTCGCGCPDGDGCRTP